MDQAQTLLLGIETSCDETAAAVIRRSAGGEGTILSNVVLSQLKEHAPYGGVVPEIAAPPHVDHLDHLIDQAMREAGIAYEELDGVAATAGPGLLGGVIVGLTMAKAIAMAHQKPLLAVNHLEGHALTARLLQPVAFPSAAADLGRPHPVPDRRRRRPLPPPRHDDRRCAGRGLRQGGEADGAGISRRPAGRSLCEDGNPQRFDFPRPLKGRKDCNFSFSGLKTAVREVVNGLGTLTDQDVADVAASFEAAVAETMADRLRMAVTLFRERHPRSRPRR